MGPRRRAYRARSNKEFEELDSQGGDVDGDGRKGAKVFRMTRPLLIFLPVLVIAVCTMISSRASHAALTVTARGPRSATAASTIKHALAAKNILEGSLAIHLRRGQPFWTITIQYFRPGQRKPASTQILRLRRGRLSAGAAQSFANKVVRLLNHPGKKRATPGPKQPVNPPPPRAAPPPANPPPPRAAPPLVPTPATTPPATGSTGQPPPPQGATDDLGFEVEGGQTPPAKRTDQRRTQNIPRTRDTDAKDQQLARPRDDRAESGSNEGDSEESSIAEGDSGRIKRGSRFDERRTVIRLEAGVGLAYRRFLLGNANWAVDYNTGLYSQFSVLGELYPLALLSRSALAKLGLRVGYESSAGLNTEVPQTGGPTLGFDTSLTRVILGLIYRLPIFSHPLAPRIKIHAGILFHDFVVEDNPRVQSLFLTDLTAGAAFRMVVKPYLQFVISGDYRAVLKGSSPVLEQYEVKVAGVQGFGVTGMVLGKIFGDLGYCASFTFERLIGVYPALEVDDYLDVRDHFVSAIAALTYEM